MHVFYSEAAIGLTNFEIIPEVYWAASATLLIKNERRLQYIIN